MRAQIAGEQALLRGVRRAVAVASHAHLAHVAALAASHYLMDKVTKEGAAVTWLSLLSGESVIDELCRMMGGSAGDAEAMAHARELRDRAMEGLLD